MSILDIIIFLFFTGGVVVFGCSFFNKKRSSEEFTSAGRSLPGWVVGMSIFATYVSSISYLAYPGKAYMSDWNAFVFSLSITSSSVRYGRQIFIKPSTPPILMLTVTIAIISVGEMICANCGFVSIRSRYG